MILTWWDGVKIVLGVINCFLIEFETYLTEREYVPDTINVAKTFDWEGQALVGEYPYECFVK